MACRKIEEKRGVTLTDSGVQEIRPSLASEGRVSSQLNQTISTTLPTTKRNSSWDEDWIPTRTAPTSLPSATSTSSTQPAVARQPPQVNSLNSMSSVASVATNQQVTSCPAVDVEWPPRPSSGVTSNLGNTEKLSGIKSASDSSLGDVDPFANWPPRPSASQNISSSISNGATVSSNNKYANGMSSQSASWAFSTPMSNGSNNQNRGNIISQSSGNVGIGSLGYLKQNQGPIGSSSNDRAADLGSIFAPSKNDHIAPRLAPPPATAVGRVGGRGRGIRGPSGSNTKSKSEQPPLLDLL